tara:strand:- start:565 stop:2811 length:2247 start_codon:yes stop_codon:yes gene_type:complete
MSNLEIKNPLYAVTIGSHIKSYNNKFEPSVIDTTANSITSMTSQEETHERMTGTSSYVYSDRMNQGSFGMSGSYGVSGLSKYEGSLSAYVGNAAANSSTSVEVTYSSISVCGIEYVDFENLNVPQFISSLKEGCRQSALEALDCYNAVNKECNDLGVSLPEALTSDKNQYPTIHDLLQQWVEASDEFCRNYGDGLVVGIAWGAMGGVHFKMTATDEDNAWKYGGQANFSYAGLDTSVSLQAIYDGSKDDANAGVETTCTSYVSGNALSSKVHEWFSEFNKTALQKLNNVHVFDKAPQMIIPSGVPKIPDFVTPKPSDDIASKVGALKNLDDLHFYAKVKAYDEAKKEKPDLTLEKFLKKTEEGSELNGLTEAAQKIQENDVDTLANIELVSQKTALIKDTVVMDPAEKKEPIVANDNQHIPLGVWIAHWSNLIPWLARGYCNNIEDLDTSESIKTRVMLQDFQTLGRIYHIADAIGIKHIKRKNRSLPPVKTAALARNFDHAAAAIQSGNILSDAYDILSDEAALIYQYWNENTFLRNAELGLGFVRKQKTIDSSKSEDSDNRTVYKLKTIDSPKSGGSDNRTVYKLETIAFNGRNYDAFSQAYKVLPLPTPDKEIWAFGPEKGLLSSAYDTEAVFSKSGGLIKAMNFIPDRESKTLRSKDGKTTLYPIRFNAAKGVNDWKGMSSSTNIGADQNLKESLQHLENGLREFSAWTFSNEHWPNNWNDKKAYHLTDIKKQYIGLIEEPQNT